MLNMEAWKHRECEQTHTEHIGQAIFKNDLGHLYLGNVSSVCDRTQ